MSRRRSGGSSGKGSLPPLPSVGPKVSALLIGISVPFVALNERRARRQDLLRQKAETITQTVPHFPRGGGEGQRSHLVHRTGYVGAKHKLRDTKLGVVVHGALKLSREVEMYQLVETNSERVEKGWH